MAFNWQTFWTRTGTALIFVAFMLAGLFWNNWSFLLLFSIIHAGCWIEYQRLVTKIHPEYAVVTPFHRYGVIVAGWSFLLYFSGSHLVNDHFSIHALGWWTGLLFLFVLPVSELLFSRNILPRNILDSALGILYLSLSLGLLVSMRNQTVYGYLLPAVVVFSIWVNDTMAYLVGSMIGKTPLTAISPKKTWEGTIGGILFSISALAVFAYYVKLPVQHTAIIAAIAAITGTFGDLLESWLKRKAGVKDSGQIMPGHGGFLDRFDSLLIAAPFVWLYTRLFL